MNRVISRAKILVAFILILAIGMGAFLGEYLKNGGDWVVFPGSPHVYNGGNIGCGVIVDRNGVLLLDLSDGRSYAQSLTLREATVHWLGDRKGNVSAPAISYHASAIAGFDAVNGIYAYGGTGAQVQLTLSAKIQMVAEEAMGEYAGTVAVYNYKTGEILCAVSGPNFDPDDPPVITDENLAQYDGVYLNRFVQSLYTPGSIFKIVTTAAALESIPDIQEQTFVCTGIVAYGNDTVTCERAHGELKLKEAFARSCNCAFAQIGNQLGGAMLERYAKQFGILDPVTFDGIKTASGSLSADGAAAVQVAWSAIGQHKDLINPCSYLTFLGAIASGGVGMMPHLVSKIQDGSEVRYQEEGEIGQRIMSTRTAETLQEYLRNNVENYYGEEDFPGLAVCAKSGTAEVGGTKKPNAMFTGFVLNEQYPYAFIVCIEDGGYGRQVCTPIISKILAACREEVA